jgi:hypothetical protein
MFDLITVRELLQSWRADWPVTFVNAERPDSAILESRVNRNGVWQWEDGLNGSSGPQWPIESVKRPALEGWNPLRRYRGSFVIPETDEVGVVYEINTLDDTESYTGVVLYKRKSPAEYWPDEASCLSALPRWIDGLKAALLESMEYDESEPYQHWRWGKRRYGLKDNQTCRMLFVLGLDPEGRHRCLYEPMPDYFERWLRYADFCVGVAVGVDPDRMEASDLYASGAKIDEAEMLDWCKSAYRKT